MPGLPPLPTACVLLIAWPCQHPWVTAGGLIVGAVLGLVIAGRV